MGAAGGCTCLGVLYAVGCNYSLIHYWTGDINVTVGNVLMAPAVVHYAT